MATESWNWKPKDGSRGGLLYESGNWGDLLKLLWLAAVAGWKSRSGDGINYFDPFAGDVKYPLGRKTRFRFDQAGLKELDFVRPAFVDDGFWPSSASAMRLLLSGRVEVWDADPGRRENWAGVDGVELSEGESGWTLLEAHLPDPLGLWLIDPYDFIAEWRTRLPLVAAKSRTTSTLVYIYNRAARTPEAFAEYRAFRNALEDVRADLPKRLGRVAADEFLPRSHHEMLFLPGSRDAAREDFGVLSDTLGKMTAALNDAVGRAGVFGA